MRTRYVALLMAALMMVSSVSFLTVGSSANDLNEPIEYRDEMGEIIGESQYGMVPLILDYGGSIYPDLYGSAQSRDSIVVDGVKDVNYHFGLKGKISLTDSVKKPQEAYGDVYFVCDYFTLYVFVEVYDDSVVSAMDYISICDKCGKQRAKNSGCEHMGEDEHDKLFSGEPINVWDTDYVEIFVDEQNDGSIPEVYSVTRDGVAFRGHDTWGLDFEAAALSGSKMWCAEFAIPMPEASIVDEWGVNVNIRSNSKSDFFEQTTVSLNNYNSVVFSDREDYDRNSDYFDYIVFPNSVKTFNRTPYTDISYNDWYYRYALWAIKNGIFNGVSATAFSPDTAMTRAMFVTVLYRMAGSPEVTGEMPFIDLEEGGYYYDAVLWAYRNEVINGITPDIFGHDGTVTREQLVTILYRYTEKSGYDVSIKEDLSEYPDANRISDYAKDAMSWAVGNRIIYGAAVDGEVRLSADGMATRAQVAAILRRYAIFLQENEK